MSDAEIEIARLKAVLDSVDDHGRAASFMETLREKDAELTKHERDKDMLVMALDAANTSLNAANKSLAIKNEIIRELLAWIQAEFEPWKWQPDSPGRKLWDRARHELP